MSQHPFRPLTEFQGYPTEEMINRAASFSRDLNRRRTVREFSPEPVPREVIESCLMAANSAPSGANRQPWHFSVITDPAMKTKIRQAAEEEERAFYDGKAPDSWLTDLEPFETNADKPFLEVAPYLIAIFAERFIEQSDGSLRKNYYVPESVGIATGMLITALHHAGLVTLTHTPSPMGFLKEILNRPRGERAYLLLVAGYPANNVQVPDIKRKPLSDFTNFIGAPGAD